jgi:hypothetical protein
MKVLIKGYPGYPNEADPFTGWRLKIVCSLCNATLSVAFLDLFRRLQGDYLSAWTEKGDVYVFCPCCGEGLDVTKFITPEMENAISSQKAATKSLTCPFGEGIQS